MAEASEKYPDVYDFILTEETDFKTRKIPLASNWDWNMHDHVERSFMLLNSQYMMGSNEFDGSLRPNKNIILPIRAVNVRSEGFNVTDVEIYVNNPEKFHYSLIARKYHEKWAMENSIDTAIDESVESSFDYGLALVKNVNEARPEIVQPQQIAFCDQTDILSGPICLKHNYSIDQLLEMKGKWYEDEIDRAVLMSKFGKRVDNKDAKTPGKYIEVYELHGAFPESWLAEGDEYVEDNGKYTNQIHIVTYYVDQQERRNGICLFKGKEPKPIFKAFKRDSIHGRACGRGGVEELFHPQIWTNYSEIHLRDMLEATSKVITKTTDKKLAQANKNGLKHNQIVHLEEGKTWEQMVIQPFNKAAFDNYVNAWEQTARTIGSASDPSLGLNSKGGTPLGETQIVAAQGAGIHEYRQGKLATFWGEIYRDWVFQYLAKEMEQGDEWLDELSLDELREVADKVSTNESNSRIKEMILSGKMVAKEEQDLMVQVIKESFMKGGKKKFMKIMKGEFKKLPLEIRVSIAGKQKNLAETVNKLNGIFRTVFANPAILQSPGMAELFNSILESSGLSPIDFSSFTQPVAPEGIKSPIQAENLTTPNELPA